MDDLSPEVGVNSNPHFELIHDTGIIQETVCDFNFSVIPDKSNSSMQVYIFPLHRRMRMHTLYIKKYLQSS